MNRFLSAVVAAFVVAGCSRGTSEPASEGSPPPGTLSSATANTFIGEWRSTTPSAEFVRLTVSSLSIEQGALGARLTFSGVAWEGSGRVEAGALVANMSIRGATGPTGVMTARAGDGQTLRVQIGPTQGTGTDLTFVRDN